MTTAGTAHAEKTSYFATLSLYSFLDPEDTVVYLDIDDSQMREEGNEKDMKIGKME